MNKQRVHKTQKLPLNKHTMQQVKFAAKYFSLHTQNNLQLSFFFNVSDALFWATEK